MCGRYYLKTPPAQLMDRFSLDFSQVDYVPNPNVSPTDVVPVVLNILPRQLSQAKWGLIPSWSKDPRSGAKMINARSESILDKPAFRLAFQRRRCLIPSDGFYEWRNDPEQGKIPVSFSLKSGAPFAFAGLWEIWRPPAMEPIRSCTILTTDANELVSDVHNRMPVILPRDLEREWLRLDEDSIDAALAMLQPFPADLMRAEEVPPGVLPTRQPRKS